MSRRARYEAYAKAMAKWEKKRSSPKSVLKKLQEYKDQNVVISVPVGGNEDGK